MRPVSECGQVVPNRSIRIWLLARGSLSKVRRTGPKPLEPPDFFSEFVLVVIGILSGWLNGGRIKKVNGLPALRTWMRCAWHSE